MTTPEELQAQAKSDYHKLTNQKGAVGQFKQILPMSGEIAIAVVRASNGLKAKEDLEHEVALLKELRKHGYPALQTYGNVFEIAEGKHAVVMDWIPNANLIDGKSPEMINYLLPALMLNVPINTSNEAWAIQLPQTIRKIQLASQKCDFAEVQVFAENLSYEISHLQQIIDDQKLIIGDLQLLISPEGKITIIDPLDVLRIVPKNSQEREFDFVDIMDPSKPNSREFIKSLMKSMEMLENMRLISEAVAKVKNQQSFEVLINNIVIPHSTPNYASRAGSAPISPVMPRVNVARANQSAPSSPAGGEARLTQPKHIRPEPKRRAAPITPVKSSPDVNSPLKKRIAKDDIRPPSSNEQSIEPTKPGHKKG